MHRLLHLYTQYCDFAMLTDNRPVASLLGMKSLPNGKTCIRGMAKTPHRNPIGQSPTRFMIYSTQAESDGGGQESASVQGTP